MHSTFLEWPWTTGHWRACHARLQDLPRDRVGGGKGCLDIFVSRHLAPEAGEGSPRHYLFVVLFVVLWGALGSPRGREKKGGAEGRQGMSGH